MNAVKTKYFDNGWRSHIATDYQVVGLVLALSVLQNGLLPRFFPEEMLEDIFKSDTKNPCIKNLRRGMDKVGPLSIFQGVPKFALLIPRFKCLHAVIQAPYLSSGANIFLRGVK